MEQQIEALDERLANDPAWQDARARFDDRLLMESLTASKQICYFFAHDENITDRALGLAKARAASRQDVSILVRSTGCDNARRYQRGVLF